ncbi:hypothetical protein [Pseudobacteroides cellulosolvens]|uniref:hypothetical protein n=1 Tax=Pseudobacteroides cellulosolvens TaxID=35825 RepID=UPI00128F8323|nr:hypothetical protein [Pseudobacteroides cellulosolvens]
MNTVKIMDKPLFVENEIEIMTDGILKVNKEFFVAKGEGIDTGLLSEDNTNKTLKYEIDGKRFEVNQSSNNFLYNYYIHGVCVVSDGNRIIFVKQNDFNKAYAVGGVSGVERKTKKGAIGIPYVLVVDGKRNELGVIKIGEGDFAVPEIFDSWTYMGFPDNLPNLIPNASTLSKEQTD